MDCKIYFLILILCKCCHTLIVPEELSSLLSVVYSNIPPIKKGTDSRVGFGFAFGNHADAQIVLEIGPQSETGKVGEPFNSNSKREVEPTPEINKIPQSDAGKHLLSWYHNMKGGNRPVLASRPNSPMTEIPNLEESLVDLQKNENGEFEIRQPPPANIDPQVLSQLKQLYGYKAEPPRPTERSREEEKRIKEDLSNVDLD